MSRWDYLRATLIWRAVWAIFAIAGAYDLFTSQFASDWPRIADGAGLLSDAVPFHWWIIGFLVLLVAATFEGGYRQFKALAPKAQEATPYAEIGQQLADQTYQVGQERTGDDLFLELGPLFREPISQPRLSQMLFRRIVDDRQSEVQEGPDSGHNADKLAGIAALEILNDWYTAGLLESETVHSLGNPSSPGVYSINDPPRDYSLYRLSALGREVLQHLKGRASQSDSKT